MQRGFVRPARRHLTVCLLVTLGLGCAANGPEPTVRPERAGPSVDERGPRLVLVIAVDQLRPDRVHARQPGGLGRMARSGRVFTEAALEHARTETCAGHATMLTGMHPAGAGVPGNTAIDRERLAVQYCVEDRSGAGFVLGGGPRKPEEGRSPQAMRATTLGDWLKAERPTTRVYAVSAKDRAAITLGGRRPDGVYWLDREGSGRITTSRYYAEALPEWMDRWDVEGLLEPVPPDWVHPSGDPPNGTRADAFPGESPVWSMTSPHPVKPEGNSDGSVPAFVRSPFLDQRTLEFARELIVEERIGGSEAIDVLSIGLSGTDYIGHSYGPWSQESRDALIRLDRDLDDFLDFVDERIGLDRVIVVLTSDHGVLPLPEWLEQEGGSCPVGGGRVDPGPIFGGLTSHLDETFGGAGADLQGRWLVHNGFEIVFRDDRLAEAGVTRERAIEVAEAWLEQQPGVARVWRDSVVARGQGSDPMLRLYRNNRVEGLHPDLSIEPANGCLFSSWPAGTSHGSPHDYDRDVPLIFMGPGIEPGQAAGRAGPVDIAPTVARQLGLEVPKGLDGEALPLSAPADQP